MTNQPSASDADLRIAVETLITRLEREHAWAQELRADLDHTDREIAKLLSACDAAIHALPTQDRTELQLRVAQIALKDQPKGRPPKDRRYTIMMDFLSKRPNREVTSAEIRTHLGRHGLQGTSRYVGCTMHRWCNDGMISRLAQGRYLVNGADKRLRALRLQPAIESHSAAVKEEIAQGRAAAEERFEQKTQRQQEAAKAEEIKRKRMKNFNKPPSEWDA